MTRRFRCSICGEEHDGLVTDWAYTLSDVVWAMPDVESSEKTIFCRDLCKFGERRFIRCVLEIPMLNKSDSFGWGAWAEIDIESFERYLELYDRDGASEPTRAGALANSLLAYPETLGAPVIVQFRRPSQRPSLHLTQEDTSQLALEQRNGIDDVRYHEILTIIAQR